MIIAIEGIDGAGKTTLINKLMEIYPYALYFKPVTLTEEFEAKVKKATDPYMRQDLIREMMWKTNDDITRHNSKSSLIFIDRWICSALVYQLLEGIPYEVAEEYIKELVIPDATIFLEVDACIAHRRLLKREAQTGIKRTRYEETEEILVSASKLFHKVIKDLSASQRINTFLVGEFLHVGDLATEVLNFCQGNIWNLTKNDF